MIDHDEIEVEGDVIRRRLLASAEADGADAESFGVTLAGLRHSEDETTRLRALELFVRLTGSAPSRRKKVDIKSDHRTLVAVIGAGQLAGGAGGDIEYRIAALPPAERRAALAALDELKALTEGGKDGTGPEHHGEDHSLGVVLRSHVGVDAGHGEPIEAGIERNDDWDIFGPG